MLIPQRAVEGVDVHYYTHRAVCKGFICDVLIALVLVPGCLADLIALTRNVLDRKFTLRNAISMLSFGTPRLFALLRTAARAVFFSGSAEPPSTTRLRYRRKEVSVGRTSHCNDNILLMPA